MLAVFDSGVGGLTVYRELAKRFVDTDMIYLGDTARVPYGNRSEEVITRYALECASYLRENFAVSAFIIACNTVSSCALPALASAFSLPLLGVIEAGAARALKLTRNLKVGVIGTRATVKSGAYTLALHKKNPKAAVYETACPLFVPLVEEGLLQGEIVELTVRHYLKELEEKGIDTLILGCTHYPLLKSAIRKLYPHWEIADSAEELCDEAERLSLALKEKGERRIMVTDDIGPFKSLKEMLVGEVRMSKITLN